MQTGDGASCRPDAPAPRASSFVRSSIPGVGAVPAASPILAAWAGRPPRLSDLSLLPDGPLRFIVCARRPLVFGRSCLGRSHHTVGSPHSRLGSSGLPRSTVRPVVPQGRPVRRGDASQVTAHARVCRVSASKSCSAHRPMWINEDRRCVVFFSRVDRQRSGRPVGRCYICAAFSCLPECPIRRVLARPPVAVGSRSPFLSHTPAALECRAP